MQCSTPKLQGVFPDRTLPGRLFHPDRPRAKAVAGGRRRSETGVAVGPAEGACGLPANQSDRMTPGNGEEFESQPDGSTSGFHLDSE